MFPTVADTCGAEENVESVDVSRIKIRGLESKRGHRRTCREHFRGSALTSRGMLPAWYRNSKSMEEEDYQEKRGFIAADRFRNVSAQMV